MTVGQPEPAFKVADAFRIAIGAHAEQVDKSGKPYIGHIWRVMSRLEGDDEKMAAALHDYLEDVKGATVEHLRSEGVPDRIIEAVEALTKSVEEESKDEGNDHNEGYFDFVRRAATNPIARKVKRADLLDNTDPERARIFAESNGALAAELRHNAAGYRSEAETVDEASAELLASIAEQFEAKAKVVEAKPRSLMTKYEEALRILDELDSGPDGEGQGR